MKPDKIVSITKIGELESIDIEVSGNHYFYANDILTHNSNSDPGLEDTSESFGLPATADFMIALISTEELQDLDQIMIKQLKNRYADPAINRRFVVGIDKPKMRLYDLDESAQKGVMNEDKPLMDSTGFGQRAKEDDSMKWTTKKMGRKDFSGLKV